MRYQAALHPDLAGDIDKPRLRRNPPFDAWWTKAAASRTKRGPRPRRRGRFDFWITVCGVLEFSSSWLDPWAQTRGGTAILVNHSENHTFRIESGQGVFFLRVHRPGYQSEASIDSELAWLRDIRQAGGVAVPEPVAGQDGRLLQFVAVPGEAALRPAVLFGALPGREPGFADDLLAIFERLGRIAARLHVHAARFSPPPGFFRPRWDAAAILEAGAWGDWRTAPGVDDGLRALLEQVAARIAADLAAFGDGPERFGLVHADMRLANLLVEGDDLAVIDFDDSGFSWHLYDFAAAVSFFEDHPLVPELARRWVAGYRGVRDLPEADLAAMGALVMLRRMALLAWIGSHAETELARSLADDFAAGTGTLGRRYIAGERIC